jgi:hypothetical protein
MKENICPSEVHDLYILVTCNLAAVGGISGQPEQVVYVKDFI